jgi:hypothetical protein
MRNKKTVKYPPALPAKRRRGIAGPGRPKGTLNKVTVEARAAAAQIIDDPIYRQTLLDRAQTGQLPPAIEVLMWHYAKGKPREQEPMPGTVRFVWGDPDEDEDEGSADD